MNCDKSVILEYIKFDNQKWLCFETTNNRFVIRAKCIYVQHFYFYVTYFPTPIEVPYVVFDNIALTRMGVDIVKGSMVTPNNMMVAVKNDSINKHIQKR